MRNFHQTVFLLIVTIHMIILFGIVLSFFILPFAAPWYIALPLCVFIVHLCTTRIECPLTNLENVIRQKLGKKRIGGFVGHYFVKPIKRFTKQERENS